jgi:short-subunit dehydrogenase
MQHEITEMLIQGKGTIVNCSSVAGLVGEGLHTLPPSMA